MNSGDQHDKHHNHHKQQQRTHWLFITYFDHESL